MTISWVLATRNDGYGGVCEGIPNFTMKRLWYTCKSIRAISNIDEIIVVEYAPEPPFYIEETGYLKDIPNVTVLTIPLELHHRLRADSDVDIPFYEYVAKHLGIMKSQNEYLIICNPDNIFPKKDFETVIDGLEKTNIVRAKRVDIKREMLLIGQDEIFKQAEEHTLPTFFMSMAAAGDFTAIPRKLYDEVDGYRMVHGNWHCDNDLVERLLTKGYQLIRPYLHYHIDHDNSIVENITPTNFPTFKPISAEIVRAFPSYIHD